MRRERVFSVCLEHVKKRKADADSDKAVGDIESGPVITGPVDVEKVYHFAVRDPVDEVADGAAEDERKRGDEPGGIVAQAFEHEDDKADGDDGNADQKRQPKNFVSTGKNSERRPGIAHIGEIKKTVDDRNRVVQWHRPVDDDLCQLIEKDDRHQPADDELPFGAQTKAPALSTDAQRAQTVG